MPLVSPYLWARGFSRAAVEGWRLPETRARQKWKGNAYGIGAGTWSKLWPKS